MVVTGFGHRRKNAKTTIACLFSPRPSFGSRFSCTTLFFPCLWVQFGQPEINLGIIPGAGGTQRLARAIGKSKAMHLTLTGDLMTSGEAYASGLVARVYDEDDLLPESIKMATNIASKGSPSLRAAKEAVNASEELPLQEGLRFERRLFHALFATEDQKEGMAAFLEKRPAEFK